MDAATEQQLLRLNREFYARVADDFSRSRRSLQPGIRRVLDDLPARSTVLDLGCGDGRVGHELLARGVLARYVGIDQSHELLGQLGSAGELELVQADLLADVWPVAEGAFDTAFCFSVLHHLPGAPARRRVLGRMRTALRPGGRWAVSVWQVLHRERFRRRLRAWSELGLTAAHVEEGDVLLDWSRGALRYVHHFGEEELRSLCESVGLRVEESFRSDGDSADLGLYLRGSV